MEHYGTINGLKLLDRLRKCGAMMLHAKSAIRIRKPLLYPAELRDLLKNFTSARMLIRRRARYSICAAGPLQTPP
jgi:hypothetical protein